jgi:5-methylcytosine-specific restriction protein A
MPMRSSRPCSRPGCRKYAAKGSRCQEHERAQDAARGTSTERGYGADWRKLRAAWLLEHPLCVKCGITATDVDHVIAHRGDEALRLDPNNLQSFCHAHHSEKTAAQDGGMGRMRPR